MPDQLAGSALHARRRRKAGGRDRSRRTSCRFIGFFPAGRGPFLPRRPSPAIICGGTRRRCRGSRSRPPSSARGYFGPALLLSTRHLGSIRDLCSTCRAIRPSRPSGSRGGACEIGDPYSCGPAPLQRAGLLAASFDDRCA